MELREILADIQARRNAELRRCRAALDALLENSPEYKTLEDIIIKCNLAMLETDSDKKQLKINIAQARAEQEKIAKNIAPVFRCTLCQDTGYQDHVPCSCVRQKLLATSSSGLDPMITFGSFDLSCFTEARTQQYMARLCDRAQAYVQDFPCKQNGWLLMGNVGTGKTFLAQCMANAVAARGFTATLATAYEILQASRFENRSQLTVLQDADLLIIDDLGCEPLWRSMTVETILSLVSARLTRRRGLIITTNLSLNEIKARYSERMLSRLTDPDVMNVFELCGTDLRQERG